MGVTPPPVTACCFDSLLFLLFKTASCDHGCGGVTPTRQRSGCRHCFGTRGQARDHRRPRTIPSRSRFVRTAACVDMPSGCAGASTISVLWFRAWFRVSNTRFGGSAAFDFSSDNMITSQNDNANGQTVGALGAARGYKNPSATPSSDARVAMGRLLRQRAVGLVSSRRRARRSINRTRACWAADCRNNCLAQARQPARAKACARDR